MKKALISPLEIREAGFRVAEVCAQSFEVAAPLFWADCDDNVTADAYWFDPATQNLQLIPVPEPVDVVIDTAQPISRGAQTL